jgi:histidyl-tRNA synthetase
MQRKIQSVKGTRDLLPPETAVWASVEATARRIFGSYGYEEIRTPILENTDLFVRSVGESTDIVGKEMYSFLDRKGRNLSLRPENTASVVRAFVQHGLQSAPLPRKLFYIGPQFRYERPQKGRYRQFHQIGAELIGDSGPESDAEVILMLVRFLTELGFEDLIVQLNSVGESESRAAYRDGLRDFLLPHRASLSSDSQRRLEENPLRILDSKNPGDRDLLGGAPSILDYLTDSSREHFGRVQSLLTREHVPYRIEPRLVRGLDYYSRTVFEIVSAGLGAQDAIVGGGRYDGLVENLGGPPIPGIGFAIGEDRLIEILPTRFLDGVQPELPVFVIGVGDFPAGEALSVAELLRGEGWIVIAEMSGRSMQAALKRAEKMDARWAIIIGEDEVAKGSVTVRDLKQGEQSTLPKSEVVEFMGRVR